MKILVLNAGSSSIKYQLFNMGNSSVLATGLIEKIGENDSLARIKYPDAAGVEQKIERINAIKNHEEALAIMNELLIESGAIKDLTELDGIGHRVVQGGSLFSAPSFVTDEVIDAIDQLIPLAPLHNPANLSGIKVAMHQSPGIPNVAVFDTAFHSTLPKHAFLYALPYKFYTENNVRRYGFHGTSHHYIIKEAAKYLGKDVNELNAITLHLGNGASMCAVQNGKSIDTTMGLTPLEGLIMGTRCGDIDPAIMIYLARTKGYSIDDLDKIMNKESGLKGICGNNDMREVGKLAGEGDAQAQLALDMFSYRLKKYIGAYSAVLGRVDCIIFTGGIGENDVNARLNACSNLKNLGIEIDADANSKRSSGIMEVNTKASPVKVLVIPTNEELEIAMQTQEVIENLK